MMNKRYLVALDQGTTSSRAVVFTLEGHMICQAAQEFPRGLDIFPFFPYNAFKALKG